MCVICVKPKGVAFPPASSIEHMFKRNPDGAGFMFVKDDKVQIHKGYMKLKKFMRAIEHFHLGTDDTVVMHFRIATAGSVSPQNTHPFPVSESIADIKATHTTTDMGVAHNGILSYPADKAHDLSDTMTFVREVLATEGIKQNLMNEAVLDLLDMAVGSSKLVFMDKAGRLAYVGNWKQRAKNYEDECWYSNLFWEPVITFTGSQGSTTGTSNKHTDIRKTYQSSSYAAPDSYYMRDAEGKLKFCWDIYDCYFDDARGCALCQAYADIQAGRTDRSKASKDVVLYNKDSAIDQWARAKYKKEKMEKELKKENEDMFPIRLDYDATDCPKCHAPISFTSLANYNSCTKCGVFFIYPHEIM